MRHPRNIHSRAFYCKCAPFKLLHYFDLLIRFIKKVLKTAHILYDYEEIAALARRAKIKISQMKNYVAEFTPESHLQGNKFFKVIHGKTDRIHSVGLHKHDFVEILWIKSGSGTLIAGSKVRAFSKNFLYISKPWEVHVLEPDKNTLMTFTEIVVERKVVEDFNKFFFAGESGEFSKEAGGVSVKLTPFEISYFDRAASELAWKNDSIFAIYRFLANVHWQIKNVFSAAIPGDIPEWLYEACQRIRNPENLPLGLAKFRELCGKDMSYINRTVRKYLKCTPTDFINDARLRYAKWLLETSSFSTGEISEVCGFSDVAYFCRKFKKKYDMTPGGFRKSAHPDDADFPFANPIVEVKSKAGQA